MRETVRLFKALGEEPRLEILALMFREGDLCGCEVETFLGLSQSAASRHLRTLREAGLVEDRREGQWVYYGPPADPEPLPGAILALLRERLPAPDLPDLGTRLEEMRAVRCATRPAEDAATVAEPADAGRSAAGTSA